MSATVPNYSPVYSQSQIAERVRALGSAVSPWCEEVLARTGREVLAVPLLRGALFFAADLLRAISASIELAPISVSTYEKGVNAVQSDSVTFSLTAHEIAGRSILLIDDICDSGKTLSAVSKEMVRSGAGAVRSVVLIERTTDASSYTPDWKGFEYSGPEWFVGYGLDDSDKWRHLPYVAVINK